MAKKNAKTILVTGATGHQGGAVFRHLREKGSSVRALTRDPSSEKARKLVGPGAEVVRGDLNDPASLRSVIDGVDGVYSVQNSMEGGVETEVREGKTLADVANRSGITQFVYSSVGSADRNTGIPHFDSKFQIEEHLRGTGLPYTILRPVFFMENWLEMRGMIEQGTLTLPLSPDTRLQMIAVDDIGAFGSMAFEQPGHWQGRAVDLAGDELSMTELAESFGRVSGREVRYVQAPWDGFEKKAGHEMTLMYRWFEAVGYHVDIAALREEYSKLTNFERWLQSTWKPALARAAATPRSSE
jgi:uncharacterized protein YbjT (DUF2867 family)